MGTWAKGLVFLVGHHENSSSSLSTFRYSLLAMWSFSRSEMCPIGMLLGVVPHRVVVAKLDLIRRCFEVGFVTTQLFFSWPQVRTSRADDTDCRCL